MATTSAQFLEQASAIQARVEHMRDVQESDFGLIACATDFNGGHM
jgi:hypothetical protein